jgi:hypothetical protein
VNPAQYAALAILVAALFGGSLDTRIMPVALAIVGVHFLPLALLFKSPAHAWIGLAMLLLAAAIMLLRLPPFSPVGIFAGGAVLLGGSLVLAWEAMRQERASAD